jgi:hypothetical protein
MKTLMKFFSFAILINTAAFCGEDTKSCERCQTETVEQTAPVMSEQKSGAEVVVSTEAVAAEEVATPVEKTENPVAQPAEQEVAKTEKTDEEITKDLQKMLESLDEKSADKDVNQDAVAGK